MDRVTKAVTLLLLVAGCTPIQTDGYTFKGQTVPVNLFMAPLCLFICPVSVQTTGSAVKTIGAGATGSSTQTASQTAGAIGGS